MAEKNPHITDLEHIREKLVKKRRQSVSISDLPQIRAVQADIDVIDRVIEDENTIAARERGPRVRVI